MANILIFEDNLELVLSWKHILETECQHRVYHCSDVSTALECVERINPEVLIVDMFIRTTTGFSAEGGITLLGRLKLMERFSPSLIAVSGARPSPYRAMTPLDIARNFGVDVALYKPIKVVQLIKTINQLLCESQSVE